MHFSLAQHHVFNIMKVLDEICQAIFIFASSEVMQQYFISFAKQFRSEKDKDTITWKPSIVQFEDIPTICSKWESMSHKDRQTIPQVSSHTLLIKQPNEQTRKALNEQIALKTGCQIYKPLSVPKASIEKIGPLGFSTKLTFIPKQMSDKPAQKRQKKRHTPKMLQLNVNPRTGINMLTIDEQFLYFFHHSIRAVNPNVPRRRIQRALRKMHPYLMKWLQTISHIEQVLNHQYQYDPSKVMPESHSLLQEIEDHTNIVDEEIEEQTGQNSEQNGMVIANSQQQQFQYYNPGYYFPPISNINYYQNYFV